MGYDNKIYLDKIHIHVRTLCMCSDTILHVQVHCITKPETEENKKISQILRS